MRGAREPLGGTANNLQSQAMKSFLQSGSAERLAVGRSLMTLPSSLSRVDSRKLCVRMSNACGYCLARLATLLRTSECSC